MVGVRNSSERERMGLSAWLDVEGKRKEIEMNLKFWDACLDVIPCMEAGMIEKERRWLETRSVIVKRRGVMSLVSHTLNLEGKHLVILWTWSLGERSWLEYLVCSKLKVQVWVFTRGRYEQFEKWSTKSAGRISTLRTRMRRVRVYKSRLKMNCRRGQENSLIRTKGEKNFRRGRSSQ